MTTLRFPINDLIPYINWVYFYHAWGVDRHSGSEIRHEADEILRVWAGQGLEVLFRVRLLLANSMDEDILLYDRDTQNCVPGAQTYTLPLLRQQVGPYLCLADFLPPAGTGAQTMGVFVSSAPFPADGILCQTLADRLAEAAAELGHEIVRKRIWGYSPDENLTAAELFAEHYQGKRPAVGYPSLPDQSLNFLLDEILGFGDLGITLTESGAMVPHASTSGLMISHPQCRHFKVGDIGDDQLGDYARRRGMDPETLRRFLPV